ncbi:uncharacterized protein LOC116259896 [Nymphaea colorata]|nr:uncharacterized protein LOC116259896 [Nymphaea colorata]
MIGLRVGSGRPLPSILPSPPNSAAKTRVLALAFSPRNLCSRGRFSRSGAPTQAWKLGCYAHERSPFDVNNAKSEENQAEKLEPNLELNGLPVEKQQSTRILQKIVNVVSRFLHVEPWTVPWTAETILQVMLLWIASFWFVGSWTIPFIAHTAGISKETLTYRGQALYSLLTDIAEGLAGIAILHSCLSRYQPLPPNWFRFSLKGKWQLDVALGCLMFPLVNRLAQINLDLLPFPSPMTSNVEQSIMARDPIAMSLYAIVVSVCAPIWEEIMFRGFLLPSLTRYMPVWCAVGVSSLMFALAHFNVQRMLPLVFLGLVMGIVFTRSRNLLASMILHSLWNGFVFLDLMK